MFIKFSVFWSARKNRTRKQLYPYGNFMSDSETLNMNNEMK